MITRLFSANPGGLDQAPIEVEVDVRSGMPKFEIIGCVENTTKEGKGRILAAIKNSSYQIHDHKIVVNLAPSGLPKLGAGFDLPIAIGILTSSGIIRNPESLTNAFLFGEVGLSGRIKSVPRAFCYFSIARKAKFAKIFCPKESLELAHSFQGLPLIGVSHLGEVVDHLNGVRNISMPSFTDAVPSPAQETDIPDFQTVRGQARAVRALTIAAAGRHHVLLIGPPGIGKTLLSRCFPGILPKLSCDEAEDVQRLHSLASLDRPHALFHRPPYRAPHHSVSYAGLIGGGSREVIPGEVSLAHHGVLFLDELGEFRRDAIEALREPLETGRISIARARQRAIFPARFQLLASSNPCSCGYWGVHGRNCVCSAYQLVRFRSKFSGPLFDRIDLQLALDDVTADQIESSVKNSPSSKLRDLVYQARVIQQDRLKSRNLCWNSEIPESLLHRDEWIQHEIRGSLVKIARKCLLSMRSFYRILRLARTIADLEGSEQVSSSHLDEAVQFKLPEEMFYS